MDSQKLLPLNSLLFDDVIGRKAGEQHNARLYEEFLNSFQSPIGTIKTVIMQRRYYLFDSYGNSIEKQSSTIQKCKSINKLCINNTIYLIDSQYALGKKGRITNYNYKCDERLDLLVDYADNTYEDFISINQELYRKLDERTVQYYISFTGKNADADNIQKSVWRNSRRHFSNPFVIVLCSLKFEIMCLTHDGKLIRNGYTCVCVGPKYELCNECKKCKCAIVEKLEFSNPDMICDKCSQNPLPTNINFLTI